MFILSQLCLACIFQNIKIKISSSFHFNSSRSLGYHEYICLQGRYISKRYVFIILLNNILFRINNAGSPILQNMIYKFSFFSDVSRGPWPILEEKPLKISKFFCCQGWILSVANYCIILFSKFHLFCCWVKPPDLFMKKNLEDLKIFLSSGVNIESN